MTDRLLVSLGARTFTAHVDAEASATLAWLFARFPFEGVVTHARWSGEAGWVRLGEHPDVPFEHATAYPAPGQLLLHPGGVSEPEILIPYGPCAFACRAGLIAGNPFAVIREDIEGLRAAGEALLQTGAARFSLQRG